MLGIRYSALEQRIRREEETIRRQTFESAFAWDAQGHLVLSKDGQRDKVSFTTEELLRLENAIFTRNHPDGWNHPPSDPRSAGNSFSEIDVYFACINNLAEMRVITPKLRFTLKRPLSGWSAEVWANVVYPLHYEAQKRVILDFKAARRAETLSSEEADARFLHETWARVAAQLGLNYHREAI